MSGLRPSTTGVYENNNYWRTVIGQDLQVLCILNIVRCMHFGQIVIIPTAAEPH